MKNKEQEQWLLTGLITAPILMIILMIIWFVLSLIRGFILTKLWAWFIVPVFHLPMLSLWQAVGVSMLVGYMTMQGKTCYKNIEEDNLKSLSINLLVPWFILFFGWIVHLLIG